MSDTYKKPLPEIRPWTKPFWDGTREGRLMLQKGKKSGKLIMYPKKYSPYDMDEEMEWIEASGKGTIYTYSIVENNAPSFMAEDVPFCVAIVELEEGVRMCTNIVDTPFDRISIGAEVAPVFDKVTEDITLVRFKVV
ncbi:MAG: OB-fold domain-containing protein [Lachnospiraceae bacterium]|nr:OB-fold domain-containing protein [Lachnospiraceae bacterium]